MDMTGERRIPAPRQTVWEALNNPDVLKASIPGCESLERLADDEMKATAAVKVGPISARFTGKVQLTDIDPPNGYRISGEGQGGVAGFAKGGANVALKEDGDDTLLSYQVNAQVGGKLAQLGGRLIDATAKQMADAFFDRFSKQVQAMSPPRQAPLVSATAEQHPAAAPAATSAATPLPVSVSPVAAHPTSGPAVAPPPAPSSTPPATISFWSLIPKEPFGLPLAFWFGGSVFAIMVLLMLGSML
jgi:uncharacterized protein